MSQVQGLKESRMAKVMEGLRMVFSALSVNENITKDPEEEVKESGIKELVNSVERIKNMESIYEGKGTSIKQVRTRLEKKERDNAPKLENSTKNISTEDIEKDEELEI